MKGNRKVRLDESSQQKDIREKRSSKDHSVKGQKFRSKPKEEKKKIISPHEGERSEPNVEPKDQNKPRTHLHKMFDTSGQDTNE